MAFKIVKVFKVKTSSEAQQREEVEEKINLPRAFMSLWRKIEYQDTFISYSLLLSGIIAVSERKLTLW